MVLRHAVFANSLSGLCVTKLDVLDGLDEVKICVGYRLDGEALSTLPLLIDRYDECEPVYETMPGWKTPTSEVTSWAALPTEAHDYLGRIETILGVPVDIVSTGPSRDAIIVRQHPFG